MAGFICANVKTTTKGPGTFVVVFAYHVDIGDIQPGILAKD